MHVGNTLNWKFPRPCFLFSVLITVAMMVTAVVLMTAVTVLMVAVTMVVTACHPF